MAHRSLSRLEREMENPIMIGVNIGIVRSRMLVFRNYRTRILISSLALLLAMASSAHGKAWRSIIPLHSDRTYVERLLGKPSMDNGDTVVYEYDAERASIQYSKEPCSDDLNTWNVPRNTVISIWVTPKSSHWTLQTFSIDPRRFNKLRDEHVLNIVHYRNETEGVEYNLDETTGSIVLVKYFPMGKDNHLRCRSSEKQRLDLLGRRLREVPSARAVIGWRSTKGSRHGSRNSHG